jgi:hypothetical protein
VESQRDLGLQLRDAIAQLERQSDSNWNGQTWVEAGWPDLGAQLHANITALISLAERWGLQPKWVLAQRSAYNASALSQRMQRKRKAQNNGAYELHPLRETNNQHERN